MTSELDRLIASHDEMSAAFDRTLTALSGGALTLSIAFVKDIAKHPVSTWALKGSWVAMACSLAAILLSFLLSVEVHRRIIAAERDNIPYESHSRWVRFGVASLNWISGALFLMGAGLLVFFAVGNV